jgi:hypothetical protein
MVSLHVPERHSLLGILLGVAFIPVALLAILFAISRALLGN